MYLNLFFFRYPKRSRKTIIFLGLFLHPKSLLPISLISQFHHLKQQMVKVLGVKPNSAKAKKSAAKIPVQISHPQSHSPTTRSNTASIRTGKPILDENEQKNYKKFVAEIKQLQGLVLAKCRLTIQETSFCPQLLQDDAFVRDFPIFYEGLTKHPTLGRRVKAVPLKFLQVGTSRAIEIINGERMRKKYSAMKTYINNVLTPIYKRCVYN